VAAVFLLGLPLAPGRAEAAAFSVYEQSPEGTALAGAMTARVDDASAIFYNPAGLGFQSGISALAGFTYLTAQSTVTAGNGGPSFQSLRGNFVLPDLYFAARLDDKVSLGIGGYTSYGLTVDWQNPADTQSFPGRYLTLRAALQTFTINPTVAVRPIPEISLAAGLDVVVGSVELLRNLNFGSADGRIDLSGGTVAVGANVGGMARLFGGVLSLGLSYRSAVSLNFNNAQVGFTPPVGVATTLPYTMAQTEIGLPHTIAAGLAVRPWSWLVVSADMNAFLWSDTTQQTITLSDATGKNTLTSQTPRNWNNAYAGRLGLEFDLSRALSMQSRIVPKVRVGFAYDQSPVPLATLDPSLPDADRYLVSGGVSVGYRGLGSVDLSYEAVILGSRTATNPSLPITYESNVADVVSLALVLNYEGILSHRGKGFGGLYEPAQ
jgi:long-chain fatty acid transport protein